MLLQDPDTAPHAATKGLGGGRIGIMGSIDADEPVDDMEDIDERDSSRSGLSGATKLPFFIRFEIFFDFRTAEDHRPGHK